MSTSTVAGAAAALAGVASVGMAVWGAPFRIADVGAAEIPIGPLAVVYFVGGFLAIGALLLTSRNTPLARGMLALGGAVLLVGVLVLAGFHPTAWTAYVPAVAMLLAAPFIGRRPPYAPEAERRDLPPGQ